MASDTSELDTIGKIIKSPNTICEYEWRIPDFVPLMNSRELLYSSTFSFAGESWRFFIRAQRNDLNVGLFRIYTIQTISLEVNIGCKTNFAMNDQERCAQRDDLEDGGEMYTCFDFLQKNELLRRRRDYMPLNTLTLSYTLKLHEATENSGDTETEKCSYCKEIMNAEDFSLHEKKCVNRPIKCPDCSFVTALKDWYDHKCRRPGAKGKRNTSTGVDVFEEYKILPA